MKKLLFVWGLLAITGSALAQTNDTAATALYEQYTERAQKQHRSSRILAYIAIGCGVSGGLCALASDSYAKNHPQEWFAGMGSAIAATALITAGFGTGITAIIKGAAARKTKKKALALSPVAGFQPVQLPGTPTRQRFAAGIQLHF